MATNCILFVVWFLYNSKPVGYHELIIFATQIKQQHETNLIDHGRRHGI
jgi:hypothetical protein